MEIELDNGIQNTCSIISEYLMDHNTLYKIKLYLQLLNSEYLDEDIQQRLKKQLNKEVMRIISFEEEYDEWFKNNML